MSDIPASESLLEILTIKQIDQFAKLLADNLDLKMLQSHSATNITTATALKAAMLNLNKKKQQDTALSEREFKLDSELFGYSQLVLGKGGELIESLISKDYKKFETILQNNKDLYLTQSVDVVLAKNFDAQALKILLKNVPKYELSQMVNKIGGVECIEFYLNMKGREQALAKEIGIDPQILVKYHVAAIDQLGKDIPRSQHLGEAKLQKIIVACINYHDSPQKKIDFVNNLIEKSRESTVVIAAINSAKAVCMPSESVKLMANFNKACTDIAESTYKIVDQHIPKGFKTTIIASLSATLEDSKHFRKLLAKVTTPGTEPIDRSKLTAQLADIVIDSYNVQKLNNNITSTLKDLNKSMASLQQFQLNEEGKTNFIKQICHKVKKLISNDYQAQAMQERVTNIKAKLTPFTNNIKTESANRLPALISLAKAANKPEQIRPTIPKTDQPSLQR